MPDKLTDNEIIKALKLLLELVLVEGCLQRAKTISKALDLINRQKAENKRLSTLAELGNTRANDYRVMRDRALKAEAENERLKEEIKKEQLYNLRMTAHSVKTEAYKEFAERLKEEATADNDSTWWIANIDVDNLLKELVGCE